MERPNFDDTQLAFAHLNNKELKRTFRLYQLIDSPFLTKIGPPMISFAFKIGLPIKGFVRKTIFQIFCGGESIKGTENRSKELFKSGVRTILDYSVEGEKSESGFDATRDEIIRTVKYGAEKTAVAFSALKVTGLADFDLLTKKQAGKSLSDIEVQKLAKAKNRLEAICRAGSELGQPVFIDAEESWIQDVIDTWAEEMMEKYNKEKPIVYTTIQFYRKNMIPYFEKLIKDSKERGYYLGIKLVRGAYMEKERERAEEMGYPSPIQDTKADTDRDYDAALKLSVDNFEHVAICAGTHNAESSALLAQLITEKGIDKGHIHMVFAQLLGMSDNISFNLAHHGFNVAKYLPYGPVKAVLPYLFRRADENTAVAGQAGREVMLLKREVKRRKSS